MKKNELNKLSLEELKTKLKESNESLMNMRFQKALQQLEHPKQITKVRKEIAQIKTVIREFDLGIRGKGL
jgi:large subunit ribosomal protein L29